MVPRLVISSLLDLVSLIPGSFGKSAGSRRNRVKNFKMTSPGAATGDYVTATSGGVQRTVG